MDDAQRRAKDFNAEQRIAELEAEVARLRLALKQQRAENEVRALVRGLRALIAGRITLTKLPKKKAPKTERDVIEYVNALADDAAAHPEKLGDVGQLIEGDDVLLRTPKRKPTNKKQKAQCPTCTRGYATIKADFDELGPKLADAAGMRAHYAELHGHAFDAPSWDFASMQHCPECHAAGVIAREARRRRRAMGKKP